MPHCPGACINKTGWARYENLERYANKFGGSHIAFLQLVHKRRGMYGRAGVDHSIDQGEADGAAQIAH
jgi:hypothetical protein